MPPLSKAIPALFGGLFLVLALGPGAADAARVGDSFRTVRGDDSPGGGWYAMAALSSGRLVAVGAGGGVMISDNNGLGWDFRKLEIDGKVEDIALTDIVEFGPNSGMAGTRLAAIGVWLEPGISADWPFAGRTYVFLSNDGGESWSRHPFPEVTTVHDTFGPFDGVALQRLFVTDDGRLLAYGTTMVSNIFITWSVGGLVYRSNDGMSWDRSTFQYGPLEQIADTGNGRMVAAGFSTLLDSADGAGWNGYLMREAAVITPDGSLSPLQLQRLSINDVVVHDDHYVATAVTYVPFGGGDALVPDKLYNLDSDSAFGGTNTWQGRQQASPMGRLVSDGSTLAQLGRRGVYTSNNNGQSWSRPVTEPVASHRAFARSPSGTWYGVGQSSFSNSGLAVWKGSSLTAWEKVFDRPQLVSMTSGLGASRERLFACGLSSGQSGSINAIHASFDKGETWQIVAAGLPGCRGRLIHHGDRLLVANGVGVNISDDNGETWRSQQVLPDGRKGASALTRTRSGRLILAAEGSINSFVYISDDGGDTWSDRPWGLQFNEPVRDIMAVGGRRVIALTQVAFSINPRLFISDDDGDSWRLDTSLQFVPGLPQAGDSSVLELKQIVRSPSGRLMIRAEDAIVTSDDNGNTWQYRFGVFNTNNLRAGPWWGNLSDLVYINKRWLMPMVERDTNEVIDHKRNWMLVSDDDGTTWYRREIPSRFQLARGTIAAPGRVVVLGGGGAVWASDGDPEVAPESATVLVRAGDEARVSVPRPPIPGALDMAYFTVSDPDAAGNEIAVAGTHYDKTEGVLSWAAGDNSPREVLVPTYNTLADTDDPMRRFLLRLNPGGEDMEAEVSIPVSIMNTGGPVNSVSVQLMEMDQLVMSVDGASRDFRLALGSQPAEDVRLHISLSEPVMASVAPAMLTFTNANWNLAQAITVTPVDGSASPPPVPGTSYEIVLTVDSTDPAYGQHLDVVKALYRYPTDHIFYDGIEATSGF